MPEHDARAAAAVEVVGKQVRRQRRQDVLHRAVLVDIAGDAQRRQLAHFVGARHRAAEDENRQPPVVELADVADDFHAGRVRQPQIEHQQVELVEFGADARQQFRGAFRGQRAMAGAFDRRLEAVAHKRRVIGDENGFRGGRSRHLEAGNAASVRCRLYQVLVIIPKNLSLVFRRIRSVEWLRIVPSATH